MPKINFIPPVAFDILKFKNPVIWLAKSIFALTQEPDFSQICSFDRIIKVIMVLDLNPKNLHINGLIFAKSKKPYFWGVFGHYPKMRFLPEMRFLPLRQPNFMRSSRKILWAVSEKMHLPIDILTVVKS